MCERRNQSEISVPQLQRERGIVIEKCDHELMLEEDGYQQLAKLVFTLPIISMRALQALSAVLSFEVGPRGCAAAAPARGANPALDKFIDKFSNDFEYWVSPSARAAGDMKGMIIVLGEHHFDAAIQAMIKKVMLEFRRTRNDRFFMEGGSAQVCQERVRRYEMRLEDCRLLEQDSAVVTQLIKLNADADQKLKHCVEYIKQHVPAARYELSAQNKLAYLTFAKRHVAELPAAAIPGFNVLMDESNAVHDEVEAIARKLQPARDDHMAAGVREGRHRLAKNYIIVGAVHLRALRERLRDLPCVFMVPKSMATLGPEYGLPDDLKDEL